VRLRLHLQMIGSALAHHRLRGWHTTCARSRASNRACRLRHRQAGL